MTEFIGNYHSNNDSDDVNRLLFLQQVIDRHLPSWMSAVSTTLSAPELAKKGLRVRGGRLVG